MDDSRFKANLLLAELTRRRFLGLSAGATAALIANRAALRPIAGPDVTNQLRDGVLRS